MGFCSRMYTHILSVTYKQFAAISEAAPPGITVTAGATFHAAKSVRFFSNVI